MRIRRLLLFLVISCSIILTCGSTALEAVTQNADGSFNLSAEEFSTLMSDAAASLEERDVLQESLTLERAETQKLISTMTSLNASMEKKVALLEEQNQILMETNRQLMKQNEKLDRYVKIGAIGGTVLGILLGAAF